MTAAAYDYKGLRVSPTLDAPPNGPKHDTRSNGPKDGVAASRIYLGAVSPYLVQWAMYRL